MPAHEWKSSFLERIERKVAARDLLLKLGVEKSNALVCHFGTETGLAALQIDELNLGRPTGSAFEFDNRVS